MDSQSQQEKEEEKELNPLKRVFALKEGPGVRTLPSGRSYLRGENGQLVNMSPVRVSKRARAKIKRKLKRIEKE